MRMCRLSVVLAAGLALALGGCLTRGPQYVQYQYGQPAGPMASVQGPVVYAAPAVAPYQAAAYRAPVARISPSVQAAPSRGLIGSTILARAPAYRGPVYAAPAVPVTQAYGYAAYPQAQLESPYLLDAGDRLRVTVFGQEGLTNSYVVDAAGNVTLPLIGSMPARGVTTGQLSYSIAERLKQGYIREPKVAIEVEAYRPFFIHGEVTNPGQYAYVANMTVENAIAIAGGFAPRADRGKVTVSRTIGGQTNRATVGISYPLRPGDTLRIGERWF